MERHHPHVVNAGAEQVSHAFTHFARGFVGKRQRENIPGSDPLFLNQIGNSVRQHPRFPAACASENKKRPFGRFYGFPLMIVENR
ncbi:hypothetical protein SDC9_155456 [bioreactor metagenome]|uniref:Uncharacterized protein n=1 Tax=bioreactor metagenome TaxID=1076179 RepID=A0A645F3G0_9ZZZZ